MQARPLRVSTPFSDLFCYLIKMHDVSGEELMRVPQRSMGLGFLGTIRPLLKLAVVLHADMAQWGSRSSKSTSVCIFCAEPTTSGGAADIFSRTSGAAQLL